MKAAAIVLAGLVVLAGAALGAFAALSRPPSGIPAEGVLFTVERGESLHSIATRLQRERLIRSALLLRALARLRDTDDLFKAGFYRIRPSYSITDVHDLLVEGLQDRVTVTIPEGWTMSQIAAHLEKKGVASGAGFLSAARSPELVSRYRVPAENLEGYLFPDTYFLSKNMPAELIVREMADTFFRRLGTVAPEAAELDPKILQERVIMASIVEREYRVAEEAPYIASVFYNRLRRDIGLESCATVAYIVTEIQGKPYPSTITKEDTQIDSPFNTYKWAGYPPGPISNPGVTALEAAFHPKETDYYYFVLKDPSNGTHYFSRDLDEHNRAKQFYIKGVGAGS